MDKLFESYMKNASRYLTEDEEELDVPVDTEEPADDLEGLDGVDGEEGDGEEEVLELDLANPVCPSCGATLVPTGTIDTEEEDEDGNPVYEDDEADAINLLQGLGYVIYKPTAEDDAVEDDVADEEGDIEDGEDFGDEDDFGDEEDF